MLALNEWMCTATAPGVKWKAGLMEARDGNHASATSLFAQARSIYSTRDDILRSVLEEGDSWLKQGKPKRAAELVRGVLRIVTDAPSAGLLRKIEQQAKAVAPAPSPSPRRR